MRSSTALVPVEVAIDEAIEIAKEYCGAEAPEVRQRHPRRDRPRAGAGAACDDREERLREIAARLREIAAELEGEGDGDERAAELASEAAELSAEAVEEANRRAREAADADE